MSVEKECAVGRQGRTGGAARNEWISRRHSASRLGVVLGALIAAGVASAPSLADAFCGFYVSGADAKLFNNATVVALMREGTRTVLSMQNNYQGPPEDFAMVVPVPVVLQKENVKTLPRAVFDRLDQLAAPRLVEYWEVDPCWQPPPMLPMAAAGAPMRSSAAPSDAADKDLGVKIEAQFTVGEYDVVVLSAKDALGLDTWLRQNGYKIPSGAEPYLRPYVQSGSKFFVAKVNVKKVAFEGGQAMLSPLRFHYDSDTFSLPIRLGLINSKGTQDLIVHLLGRGQRYEVANYDNVAIPTNLDVADEARERFGSFYAALFDKTLTRYPRAVVTEYAWDASSCDPCPTPPLSPEEVFTLGADVLPSTAADDDGFGRPTPRPIPGGPTAGKPSAPPPLRRPTSRFRGGLGFVLTRLHARYSKESLGDDLVFKAAPPIEGGREFLSDGEKLERGARPGGVNNFQARYAIRHPWTGPIRCENPVRGRWGGPPGNPMGGPTGANPPAPGTPKAATKLAFAPRGNVELAHFVRAAVPAPDLLSAFSGPGGSGGTAANAAPLVDTPQSSDAPGGATSAVPSPSASPGGQQLSPLPPRTGGCAGCVVAQSRRESLFGLVESFLLGGAVAAWWGRSRRRRTRSGEKGPRS